LEDFATVTVEEVETLIMKAPDKTCSSDPMPTWLVKKFSNLLAPFIAVLFNVSLSTGQFPDSFKHAIVIPLLKKYNLDKLSLKTSIQFAFPVEAVVEGCPDTATATFG